MVLKIKYALITGASRGIGKAISLALADEGSNVAIVSRSAAELEQVYSEAKTQMDERYRGCYSVLTKIKR
jgi:short-subunit dehydrogenase